MAGVWQKMVFQTRNLMWEILSLILSGLHEENLNFEPLRPSQNGSKLAGHMAPPPGASEAAQEAAAWRVKARTACCPRSPSSPWLATMLSNPKILICSMAEAGKSHEMKYIAA